MQKLNHLYLVLKSIGLYSESNEIQKIARNYASNVMNKGLSKRFYQTVRVIEDEVFNWKIGLIRHLAKETELRNPNVGSDIIYSAVTSCVYNINSRYAQSIGSADIGIPSWLFNFLDVKIFPILKESFSRAIETLPESSETKAELQTWLSQTTLKQLGAPTIADALDGGVELWVSFLSNAIHEIHHNIINHSAWHRFSTYGNDIKNYNLLDAMEEGFATSIKNVSISYNEQSMWNDFSLSMAEFLCDIIKNIFKIDYNRHIGFFLHKNWQLVYDHLDEIDGPSIGIKLSEKKKDFLRQVFEIFYKNYLDKEAYISIQSWNTLKMYLSNAILSVWSRPISEDDPSQWDFVTGDDEAILIELMKDLDSKSEIILNSWKSYKKEFYKSFSEESAPCIDSIIKYGYDTFEE